VIVPKPGWCTPAKVVRVIDGDTIEVEISRTIPIRLLDCNAAEVRTRDAKEKAKGLEAKRFLEDVIERSGKLVMVMIPTGICQEDPATIMLRDSQTFDRFLAWVYTVDGQNISEVMCNAGLATKPIGE